MPLDDLPLPFLRVVAVLFGLAWGSFATVAIARIPEGQSVVVPGSRCDACGAPIPAWKNVPVLAWILLRGRASCCGAPIRMRAHQVFCAPMTSKVCLSAMHPSILARRTKPRRNSNFLSNCATKSHASKSTKNTTPVLSPCSIHAGSAGASPSYRARQPTPRSPCSRPRSHPDSRTAPLTPAASQPCPRLTSCRASRRPSRPSTDRAARTTTWCSAPGRSR